MQNMRVPPFALHRRTLLAIFIGLLLIGFVSRGPIISTCFQWYLKGYCRTCLASELTYQSIFHDNGEWIFNHPILATKNGLEEGGYYCHADRATLKISVSLLQRSVDFSLDIENPHLNIGKEAQDLKNVLKNPLNLFPLFKVHPTLTIPQGKIFVHDFTKDYVVPILLSLQINSTFSRNHEGYAAFWLEKNGKTNKTFLATFSEQETHGQHINFEFQDIECSSLLPALRLISPGYQSLEITKGKISGQVAVTLPINTSGFANGRMILKDMVAFNKDLACEMSISEAILNLIPEESHPHGQRVVHTVGNLVLLSSKIALKKAGQPFCSVEGITASSRFSLKGFRFTEAKLERMTAHLVAFAFGPWNLYGQLEGGLGSFSFDPSSETLADTFNADFKFVQGTLNLKGLDKAPLRLGEIDAHLAMRQGVFQESVVRGNVGGLKAKIELDGIPASPLVLFDFYGEVKDFGQILPDFMSRGLENQFTDDGLRITANAKKIPEGLLFGGRMSVGGKNHSSEEILFGFTLDFFPQKLWKQWAPYSFVAQHFPKNGFEGIALTSHAAASPICSGHREFMSQDLSMEAFDLKNGWFHAEKLPLSKYLAPFLFRHEEIQLGGIGKISGQFDKQHLTVNYDIEEMLMENSIFAIGIKSVSKDNPFLPHKLAGVCKVDFVNRTYVNSLPIRNATCLEKTSGLLYTEINAQLTMQDTLARLSDLTAFCSGLYFAGCADIDWSMPGEGIFKVALHAHEMHGKISQLQHLLSQLNKTLFFLKIPLEGNVALRKQGICLDLSFHKDGYELDSRIQGDITDAKMKVQPVDLSLQELSMNFDYHHQANKFELTDIQGTLLVGRPSHIEEYHVIGEGVRFTDCDRQEAQFDLRVGDKKRDMIHLSGKTSSELDENGEPCINFSFDHSLSHFGGVHPSKFELAFKDWSQLHLFQLSFDCQLDSFLADFQRVSRTGLFFLSKGLLKKLSQIESAKGQFKADFSYDCARSTLNYRLEGKDVAFENRNLRKFLFSGFKRGDYWSVDQMQLDDISLAFDVLKQGPLWNINFLGAKLGDYLLLGMEGQYSDDDSHLEAKINLFEGDLANLNQEPLFRHLFSSNIIAGQIKATGILHATFDQKMPYGVRLNLQMKGSLNRMRFNDIHLDRVKNVSFGFDSSKGFNIQNVNVGLKSNENILRGDLFLQAANFDTTTHEILIDGLHFDIPAKSLDWMAQHLQKIFPNKVKKPFADALRSAKSHGSLQGILRLAHADSYSSLCLNLNDGLYCFMGEDYELTGTTISVDPFALKLLTEYRYLKQSLRVDIHSAASELDTGEMMITGSSAKNPSPTPLKVNWKIDPKAGYYIEKIEGNLAGVGFNATCNPAKDLSVDSMNLVGKLELNLREATGLLEERIAAKIANWGLGEGYSLIGQWTISKAKSTSLVDRISFQGDLIGRDFDFFGYRFCDLSSQVSCSSDSVHIRRLAVTDKAVSVQIEQLDFFNKGHGLWQVKTPFIRFNDFKPNLLNGLKFMPQAVPKSLVIRTLCIKDLRGVLGEGKSFKGNGELTFANSLKKNVPHTMFAIPAELLAHIGLDATLLTPVRGAVDFDIKDGKVFIKRFEDVFSKGRLSKFYLSNKRYSSYVDFDGNLDLQIRMKQYNFIFKLAELFIINVQGTLKNPTYTLQKQKQEAVINLR